MNYEKIYKDLCRSRKFRGLDYESGYEILKTLDFYCSKYNSIGFNKDIFEKKSSRQNYRRVYEYLNNKYGVTYKTSVCMLGGVMSKHILTKSND